MERFASGFSPPVCRSPTKYRAIEHHASIYSGLRVTLSIAKSFRENFYKELFRPARVSYSMSPVEKTMTSVVSSASRGSVRDPAFARSPARTPALLLWTILALAIAGCSMREDKGGSAENIHLHTPVGAFDVRTNSVHAPDVGLPVYPGASETGQHGNDSGSADVQMRFGRWSLHVKAIGYRSNDPEDKVLAFYKKAMARYGDVLTCKDKKPIGEPSQTRQGLTCANDHEYNVDLKMDTSKKTVQVTSPPISGEVKLLAGSKDNQHIVEFSPDHGGTKFSLVVVQLPHAHQTD